MTNQERTTNMRIKILEIIYKYTDKHSFLDGIGDSIELPYNRIPTYNEIISGLISDKEILTKSNEVWDYKKTIKLLSKKDNLNYSLMIAQNIIPY